MVRLDPPRNGKWMNIDEPPYRGRFRPDRTGQFKPPRILFDETDPGRLKTEDAKQKCRAINSGIDYRFINHKKWLSGKLQ